VWEAGIVFRCVLPVDSHVVKKNNRNIFFNKKTGRMFPGKSSRLKSAEDYFKEQFEKEWEGKPPIDFPVNAMMVFYFNELDFYTKKGTVSKKIPDLSNLYQLPEDCLQKAGVLDNDHYICGHDGSRRYPTKDSSYIEIILSRV